MHAGLNAIIQYEWEEAAIKLLILHAQAIDLKCAPVRGEHTASHHHVKSSCRVHAPRKVCIFITQTHISPAVVVIRTNQLQ